MNRKLYQVLSIPDFNENSDTSNIDYQAISTDASTKTCSLFEAISHISISILNLVDQTVDDEVDKDKVESLSAIISDLAEIGIATNKISEAATFSAGMKYQIELGDKKTKLDKK